MSNMPRGPAGRRLKSVTNALELLRVLSSNGKAMGLTEISRELGLGKSTVHLLLKTLEDFGFVEPDPMTGGYRLGFGAFEVGAATIEQFQLGPHLAPPMEQLAALTGEAVSLAVLHERSAMIVQRFESAQVLRTSIRNGTRMPLHASAAGKCLLAHLPSQDVETLLPEEPLPKSTSFSIRSRRELESELAEVREQGFSVSENEFVVGVAAIAAPVRNNVGAPASALSLAGPTARFDAFRYLPDLRRTAEELSRLLGWTPQPRGRLKRADTVLHPAGR